MAVEGEEASVAALVEAVRCGPPGATVTEARELATEGLGALPAPFAIRK